MTKLILKRAEELRPYSYELFIERIVNIFADRGHEISLADAQLAWESYSYDTSSSWAELDNDEEVYHSIWDYFEEVGYV